MDQNEEVTEESRTAMAALVMWKDNPVARVLFPKELFTKMLCLIDPARAVHITAAIEKIQPNLPNS